MHSNSLSYASYIHNINMPRQASFTRKTSWRLKTLSTAFTQTNKGKQKQNKTLKTPNHHLQSGNNSRRTVMNSEWIKRGGTLSTSIRREREKRGSGGQDKEKYKSAFLRFRPPGYCFPPNPCFTVKTALREDTWRSAGAAFQKALARKRQGWKRQCRRRMEMGWGGVGADEGSVKQRIWQQTFRHQIYTPPQSFNTCCGKRHMLMNG